MTSMPCTTAAFIAGTEMSRNSRFFWIIDVKFQKIHESKLIRDFDKLLSKNYQFKAYSKLLAHFHHNYHFPLIRKGSDDFAMDFRKHKSVSHALLY